MPRAKQAAQKAIALDPSMGEAWISLALIRSSQDWEWEEAEACYRSAIEINPGYATVHIWYGADFLLVRGRFAEAHRENRPRASDGSHFQRSGQAYALAGRRERVRALLEELKSASRTHYVTSAGR